MFMNKVLTKIKDFYGNSIIVFLFNLYILIEVLISTELIYVIDAKYLKIAKLIVLGIISLILAFQIIIKIIKAKKITEQEIVLVIALIFGAVIAYFSHNLHIVTLAILLYALKDYNMKKILHSSYYTLIVVSLFTVLMSLIGVYPNIISSRNDNIRYAFGFGSATLAQSMVLFLFLLRLGMKQDKMSYLYILFMLVLSCVVYYFTLARTGIVLSIITFTVSILLKVDAFHNLFDYICGKKFLVIIISLLPVIYTGLSILFTFLLELDNSFAIWLNGVLSTRLRLQLDAFHTYGLTLFGVKFNIFDTSGNYIGVDNSYLFIYFNYGLFAIILVLIGYFLLMRESLLNKNFTLCYILGIIFVQALVEPYLIDYKYNIYVILLASLLFTSKKNLLPALNTFFLPEDNMKRTLSKRINNDDKVVAVVVTYNRKELLCESIKALLSQNYANLKVIVVDNNSTDGTFATIKNFIDSNEIIYFNTGKNLGGAGGFSYGIAKAISYNPNYIWVMDDDCIVQDKALLNLVSFAKKVDNNFGYLSSKVDWTDGTPCKMNIQRTSLSKEITDFNSVTKIKLASFVSLFINVAAIYQLGLPIKEFFIWGDDWEYTYRLAKDYDCYFVPSSLVIHKCKANSGLNILTDNGRLDRYYYGYRNERYFYNRAGLTGKLYGRLKVYFHKLNLYLHHDPKKKEKLEIINKALKDEKTFNPKIDYIYAKEYNIKVATFFAEPISYGGQEAFMLNMYQSFKDNNITHYVVTPFYVDNVNFMNLEKQNKLTIIKYDYNFASKLRKKYVIKAFNKFIKDYHVDVIHIQSGSLYALYNLAKLAKKSGIKRVLVHSHCAGTSNLKYRLIKKLSDRYIDNYVSNYLACSKLAAEWKFPKNIIDQNNYAIISNGILLDKFKFDANIRKEYRKQLGLSNEFVLLNVGRFSEQKNHEFIVNLCNALAKENFNFKCILVGDGELKEQIIAKIKELKLDKYFIILEKRSDIAQIMMAADCFILPSKFEGLAVTSIESQATGLYTICSTDITRETDVTDIISFIPTTKVEEWENKIKSLVGLAITRDKYSEILKAKGYDSSLSALKLEHIYRGELDEAK